jgi:hypothetical protein
MASLAEPVALTGKAATQIKKIIIENQIPSN